MSLPGKKISKILIIDDEKEVLEITREHFESCGFEVSCADTAALGLQMAFNARPHIVLLDLQLPDHPGEEVLKRIKKNLPGVKVVIVTGRSEPEVKQRLLLEGADGFFAKGGSITTLRNQVEELMSCHSKLDF